MKKTPIEGKPEASQSWLAKEVFSAERIPIPQRDAARLKDVKMKIRKQNNQTGRKKRAMRKGSKGRSCGIRYQSTSREKNAGRLGKRAGTILQCRKGRHLRGGGGRKRTISEGVSCIKVGESEIGLLEAARLISESKGSRCSAGGTTKWCLQYGGGGGAETADQEVALHKKKRKN